MPLAAVAEVETKTGTGTKTKTGTGTETEPNYIASSNFRTTKQRQDRSCRYEYPRRESNPNLRFRKPSFYPLNYKGKYVTARGAA